MAPANPQFTPQQLLEAGHRAEADGRADIAVQFYHQLTEHFAFAPEAAEARDHLERLGVGWQPTPSYSAAPAMQTTRSRKRLKYPAPRDHYRTGRVLAKLFSGLGWLMVAAGLGVAPLVLLADMQTPYGIVGAVCGAVLSIMLGLVTVASGQAARALFDHANVAHELLAIERARAGASFEP